MAKPVTVCRRRRGKEKTYLDKMASCLVPDFSAVVVVLEHLKELDKHLKEEALPSAPETCLHLKEITAAVTKLETDCRAAHEHLEVKTIENSKLRHEINNIRERMTKEIMADVAAARASNAQEIQGLQVDLKALSKLQEGTIKMQQEIRSKNESMYPERELLKAEHETIIAALNNQITLKYTLQTHLDETQAQIEDLKSCIAATELEKIKLNQKIELDREEFIMKKDNLSREICETKAKIHLQKQEIQNSKNKLESINNEKQEICSHLGVLMIDLAKQGSNTRKSTVSRCQFEKLLKEDTQNHQDLMQQRETVEKQFCEIKEAFDLSIQHLEKEIATAEFKIVEGRALRLPLIKLLAEISVIFKGHHDKENKERAKHLHISQQLLQSKLLLEECIASIVKHSHEIKEMDKLMKELLEADLINKQVFDSNQEELSSNIDAEKKKVSYLEEEKKKLSRILEEGQIKQGEHVVKMTTDITHSRKRYEELQQEEAELQQRHPERVDADLLMRYVTQAEQMYIEMESQQHQGLEQCTKEIEIITRKNEEKQKEVREKEEMLKDVETQMTEEQTRKKRLTVLTSELSRRRFELDLSIQRLKEENSALLQPKEQMKAELEAFRASHIDMLKKQASELRAVEISIYDNKVKLEQLIVENSRLHLCIRQMTEDADRARQDRDWCWQEVNKFEDDKKTLFESLQKAWEDDLLMIKDCQRSDGVVLLSVSSLLNHLKTRRQQLGNVNSLLHQQMLDFSKRLGDKTSVPHIAEMIKMTPDSASLRD